ncbi:MAG: four helix bundle protein [Candidatus Omnitrophica bacterium]|nr:four helix bundle protein [Candidatus Omnitrophota bacterium]
MQNQSSKPKIDLKTRSYRYSLSMIAFIDNLSKDMTIQTIAKQLLRSATSIGANIIEAQASSSRRDFTNFLNHSLKSANETKYWLGLLKDSHKADNNTVEFLLREVTEIANILAASILTLKGKR